MRRSLSLAIAVAFGLALLHQTGHAVVPGRINYQGLLLDAVGDPVTGNQDFVFAFYDAPSGGSSLWSESHDDVPVLDGVYDVVLGSTTPITPALVSGGEIYVEITVGGETLTPRQQFLSVPYALSAESTDSVGTVPSLYVEQVFEHVNFDGQDPPNQDPSEGTADTDGDTLPNFIDPDNDDDGIEDADELAQGSDINLVTPTIGGFTPQLATSAVTTRVTITGAGFLPGLSVSFGSESPTPQNLSFNSFDVDVGPQPAGTKAVLVTNANAESDGASFDFVDSSFSGLSTQTVDAAQATLVTVLGSNFAPGIQVSVGAQSPTPQNLTSTSFEVTVEPSAPGLTTFEVFYPSQPLGSAPFEFVDMSSPRLVFVTSGLGTTGNLGGIAGADAICASRASAASLPGTFLAWIGDATTDPATRFSKGLVWRTTTGADVATGYLDLAGGSLTNPIRFDENGMLASNAHIWTGVGDDGTAAGSDCNGWTSSASAENGRRGDASKTDSAWTNSEDFSCASGNNLYCFEQ